MKKKVVVIGAGMSGLSAGCYSQMNGYDTTIFEHHSKPGGLCTSWKRGDYLIDGCVHWLIGSSSQNPMHAIWNELRAFEGTKFHYHDEFTRIETGDPSNRKTVIFHGDAEALREHFLQIAPEDSVEIDRLAELIGKFSKFAMPIEKPFELMGFKDFMGIMKDMKPFFDDYKELKKLTVSEYATRFKNTHLREAFTRAINMPEFPFFAFLLLLSWQHSKCGGYPLGGSLAFARNIERTFLNLGGTIRYSTDVEKILVRDKKAVGITLQDGTEIYADVVISAADGYSTLFKMLDGKFLASKTRKMYAEAAIFKPFFFLSLGVNRDLSGEPHMATRITERPYVVEGKEFRHIGIKHYCFDPSSAPPGKSLVQVAYTSDYSWWLSMKDDKDRYEREKKAIANTLISQLEQFYPGITDDIEIIDTATPLTFERYTKNREGSYEGWLLTTKTLESNIKKTLPGLGSFYMAGQWVQPGGGIANSVKSGRDVIQMLCKADKKNFVKRTSQD